MDHGAGHIAPGTLAHILVHVDPPVVQALPDDGLILPAQGGHRLIDGLPGLLIGDLGVDAGHHGGVHVVHVQLVHPQQLFPQADVRGDQVVVDRLRHPGGVQRGGQGAGVLPGGGEELELLHLGGEGGGHGVLHAPVDGVQVLKGGFAQGPVLAGHEQGVGAVGQGVLLHLPVHRIGEGQVRVGQLGEDVVRGLGQLAHARQQLLLGVGQGVLPAVLDDGKVPAVQLQLRLFSIEPLQGLGGNA